MTHCMQTHRLGALTQGAIGFCA
jgi:hypothetical protein